MKLFKALFAIYGNLVPIQGYQHTKNSTVINFDDINTTNGLGIVPPLYSHLSFSNYNVLKPRDPALEGKITDNDLNCAVSSPNALIGSQFTTDRVDYLMNPKGAYFEIANATAMVEEGISPYFTLVSFNIKALDAPPGDMIIIVNGYIHGSDDTLSWHVNIPSGYHLPFLVKMQEYSGKNWDHIVGVEILAHYGEDALDWEFCMDDLEIQFFKLPDDHSANQRSYPKIPESEL